MPNIELHGFTGRAHGLSLATPLRRVEEVESKIRELFEPKPYKKDYVISRIDSHVVDHDNDPQPFIRLVSTEEHIDDVVEELKKLGYDIEIMILNTFIPNQLQNADSSSN